MTSHHLHAQLSCSFADDRARAVRHAADAPLPPLRPRSGVASTGRRLLATARLRPARRIARLA